MKIILGNSWERFKDLLAAPESALSSLNAGKVADGQQYSLRA